METRLDTERLAELIDRKCAVLDQVRELSRRQTEVVAGGNMEQLMTVLGAKHNLLSQLQEVESLLDPFRDQDPERRRWRNQDARRRCREVVDRCAAMLSEILLIEQQCEAELVRRRDKAAEGLRSLKSAGQATAAYSAAAAPRGPAQLDLSSEG